MRGRSRTALLGPSHQLPVRMRIMRIIVPRMRTHVLHASSSRPAPRVSTLVPFAVIGNNFMHMQLNHSEWQYSANRVLLNAYAYRLALGYSRNMVAD